MFSVAAGKNKRQGEEEDGTMRRIDIETILLCALIAVVGVFGIMTGAAAFAGVRFAECNGALLAGGGCTLGGLIWGILLIFNRNMVSKEG